MRAALLVALAAARAVQAELSAEAGRGALVPMLRAVASPRAPAAEMEVDRTKIRPKGVPVKLADRISFATGGAKVTNQIQEVEQLWAAFKTCYPNADAAEKAATRNTFPLQPQYSSPTKIKTTYKLLVKRFGKAGALDIVTRNPGVLVNTAKALEKQSDEAILKAVDFVDFVERNKGPITAAVQSFFLLIVVLVGYGIYARQNPGLNLPIIGQ